MVEYGKRIQAARRKQGFTVADLAFLCGVSVSAIQAYEGEYRAPRDSIKIKLADALKTTVQELFF